MTSQPQHELGDSGAAALALAGGRRARAGCSTLFFPAASMPYLIYEAARTQTRTHRYRHVKHRHIEAATCPLWTRCFGYLLAANTPSTRHVGREPRLSRGPSRQSRVPRPASSFHSTCALLFLSEALVSQNLTTAAHPATCNLQSATCIQRARHPNPPSPAPSPPQWI